MILRDARIKIHQLKGPQMKKLVVLQLLKKVDGLEGHPIFQPPRHPHDSIIFAGLISVVPPLKYLQSAMEARDRSLTEDESFVVEECYASIEEEARGAGFPSFEQFQTKYRGRNNRQLLEFLARHARQSDAGGSTLRPAA